MSALIVEGNAVCDVHVGRSVGISGRSDRNVLPFSTGRFGDFFCLEREIGQGSFGTVYMCTKLETGKQFACKVFTKSKCAGPYNRLAVLREIAILQLLAGHPNITGLHAVFEDSEKVQVVMDLCTGGELFDEMSKRGRLEEVDAALIFRQLVDAVRYCHANRIVHRDLKPENILLLSDSDKRSASGFNASSSGVALKLADFGLGVWLAPGMYAKSLVGSPLYVAPEVLSGGPYDHKVDVWSLGVILYTMLSGMLPFVDNDDAKLAKKIRSGDFKMQSYPWPFISEDAKALVRKMLAFDRNVRIPLDLAANDPWLVRHCGVARGVYPGMFKNDAKSMVTPMQAAVLTSLLMAPSKASSGMKRVSSGNSLAGTENESGGQDTQGVIADSARHMEEVLQRPGSSVDLLSRGPVAKELEENDSKVETVSLSSFKSAFSWPLEEMTPTRERRGEWMARKQSGRRLASMFLGCFGYHSDMEVRQRIEEEGSSYAHLEVREQRMAGEGDVLDCPVEETEDAFRVVPPTKELSSGWTKLAETSPSSRKEGCWHGCARVFNCFSPPVQVSSQ